MEQKQLWTTIVVAVIAAVIASVITVSVMGGSASLSPWALKTSVPKTNAQANALACSADEVCEMNGFSATSGTIDSSFNVQGKITSLTASVNRLNLYKINGTQIEIVGELIADSADRILLNAGPSTIPAGPNIFKATRSGDISFSGEVIAERSLRAGSLRALNLISNDSIVTSAYACVDYNGVIYRSLTPCR